MLVSFLIYNLILFGSTFLIYISEKCHQVFDRKFFLFAAFCLVTIPAAIRYNIAYDYEAYVNIYNEQASLGNVELGWTWLIVFLNDLGLSSQSFFVVSSIIIYGLLFLALPKRYGYVMSFTYMLLIYFQTYSIIRSSVVLNLALLVCLLFIKNQKLLLYLYLLIFIVAGVFVHKSALIYVPVLLISYYISINVFIKLRYLLLALSLLIFIYRFDIILWLIDLPIIDWLGYRGYLSDSNFLQIVELNSGIGFTIKLLTLFSPLFLMKNKLLNNQGYSFCVVLLLFGIISLIFSATFMIFDRLYLAFIISYPIAIYLLFLNQTNQWIFTVPLLLFSIMFFELSIMKQTSDKCDSLRVSPYVSIFNQYADQSKPIAVCKSEES